MIKITKKEIAECVGLWLAEGDNKTKREVTFTNNCFELIEFFHEVMNSIYNGDNFRPRLYSYSKDKKELKTLLGIKRNDYIDSRARRPYYVYRFSSVKLNSKWKRLVEDYKKDRSTHIDILRGFFAGEGNIKTGSKNNRVIRIAQKNPVDFVDNALDKLKVNFSFNYRNRSYIIWNRKNWDILAKIKIADLHPEKKVKFWNTYNEFKEYHYSKGFLKNSAYKILIKPHSTAQLSKIFNRTSARICDVLIELKKERKITNFGVRNKSYWIRLDQNIIIISDLKHKYLNLINELTKTSTLADIMGVCWKSANRRLKELERLGLARNENGLWIGKSQTKKIVVK